MPLPPNPQVMFNQLQPSQPSLTQQPQQPPFQFPSQSAPATPPPASPQPTGVQSPPPHPLADDPDSLESDQRFDQFLQNEIMQASSKGNQANAGFLSTLKNAKDSDPEAFYMIMGAFATGNPNTVLQVATHLRQSRMEAQAMRQRSLMEMSAQRTGRMEQRQFQQGERVAREQFQQDQASRSKAEQDVYNVRASLDKIGKLTDYEAQSGPIDSPEKAIQARRYLSDQVAIEKDNKKKESYLKGMVTAKRFIQPSGDIKRMMEQDPDFAASVESGRVAIEEGMQEAKQLQQERLARLQELNRITKQVADPNMKYQVGLLMMQLRDAMNQANKMEELEIVNNAFAAGPEMFKVAAQEAASQKQDAQQRMANLENTIRDLILGVQGSPLGNSPTTKPTTTAPTGQPTKRTATPEELEAIRQNYLKR